jgi:peptidoglycan hydrolase CwlO-like protein
MGGPRGVRDDAGGEHVEELDFERIVDSIESLETMLNPLLHSVALLEKEKAKEETALEREYETLRTLESNARAEARNWRERMKKAHSLAPKPSDTDTRKFAARDAGELVLSKQKNLPLPGLFTVSLARSRCNAAVTSCADRFVQDTKDEELLSTSQQIASHMESIQKNVQPIQEVLPAIARSRAALQSVLQTHLSPQQLDRILIG